MPLSYEKLRTAIKIALLIESFSIFILACNMVHVVAFAYTCSAVYTTDCTTPLVKEEPCQCASPVELVVN